MKSCLAYRTEGVAIFWHEVWSDSTDVIVYHPGCETRGPTLWALVLSHNLLCCMVGWLSTLSADGVWGGRANKEGILTFVRDTGKSREAFLCEYARIAKCRCNLILSSLFYFLCPPPSPCPCLSHCNKAEYLFPPPQRSDLLKGVWDQTHIRQCV